MPKDPPNTPDKGLTLDNLSPSDVPPVHGGPFQRGTKPESARRNRILILIATIVWFCTATAIAYFFVARPAIASREEALQAREAADQRRDVAIATEKKAEQLRLQAEADSTAALQAKVAAEADKKVAEDMENVATQRRDDAIKNETVAIQDKEQAEALRDEATEESKQAEEERLNTQAKNDQLQAALSGAIYRTPSQRIGAMELLSDFLKQPEAVLSEQDKLGLHLKLAHLYLQEATDAAGDMEKTQVAARHAISYSKGAHAIAQASGDAPASLECALTVGRAHELTGDQDKSLKAYRWGLQSATTKVQRASFEAALARQLSRPIGDQAPAADNAQQRKALSYAEAAVRNAPSVVSLHALGVVHLSKAQSLRRSALPDKVLLLVESLEKSIAAFQQAMDVRGATDSGFEADFGSQLPAAVMNEYGVAAELIRGLSEPEAVSAYRTIADKYMAAEAAWADHAALLASGEEFREPTLTSDARTKNPSLIKKWMEDLSEKITATRQERDELVRANRKVTRELQSVAARQEPLMSLAETWPRFGDRLSALLGVTWNLPKNVDEPFPDKQVVRANVDRLEKAIVKVIVEKQSPETTYSTAAGQAYANGLNDFYKAKHQTATRHFTKAIRLDPTDARFYYFRGLSYHKSGVANAKPLARSDMRRGAAIELTSAKQRLIVARALENIQGSTRTWVESYRRGTASIEYFPAREGV